MKALATILALFFGTFALAQAPACLVHFATVSASDAEGIELVKSTYLQLLETLGGKVDPATLAKLIDSGDPFEVPAQAKGDIRALQKNVAELRRMAETKGWAERAVPLILASLVQRRDGIAVEDTRRRTVVEKTKPDYRIEIDVNTKPRLTPDGRYALIKNDHNLPQKDFEKGYPFMYVHDLSTGKTETLDAHIEARGDFQIARDGKSILLGAPHGQFRRVPFENGKLDWNAAALIGPEDKALPWIEKFREGNDPNRLYAMRHDEAAGFLFDQKANQRQPLTLDGVPFETRFLHGWGVVPGTDHLYVLHTVGENSELKTYSVSGDGTMQPLGEPRLFPQKYMPDALWVNGTPVVYHAFNSVFASSSAAAAPIDLVKKIPAASGGGEMVSVAAHPTSQELLVLMRNGRRFVIHRFDGGTFTHLGSSELPPGSYNSMQVTGDGEKVVFNTNSKLIHITNWANRQ